jgi:hypothetical protein
MAVGNSPFRICYPFGPWCGRRRRGERGDRQPKSACAGGLASRRRFSASLPTPLRVEPLSRAAAQAGGERGRPDHLVATMRGPSASPRAKASATPPASRKSLSPSPSSCGPSGLAGQCDHAGRLSGSPARRITADMLIRSARAARATTPRSCLDTRTPMMRSRCRCACIFRTSGSVFTDVFLNGHGHRLPDASGGLFRAGGRIDSAWHFVNAARRLARAAASR